MVDINHFGDVRDKYNIMSVPCVIANDEVVGFGKKSVEELVLGKIEEYIVNRGNII